jgi:hypothetical protein
MSSNKKDFPMWARTRLPYDNNTNQVGWTDTDVQQHIEFNKRQDYLQSDKRIADMWNAMYRGEK